MRLLHKRTKSVQLGKENIASKNRVNIFVTASHILVTLGLSVSQTSIIYRKNSVQGSRMYSTFAFFGGSADLFLSVMLWFILDNRKAPTILVDGDRVYVVSEVIKASQSAINPDCDEEDNTKEDDDENDAPAGDSDYRRPSLISKRMIDQFFHEEEGLDRDWSRDDYDDCEDERAALVLED